MKLLPDDLYERLMMQARVSGFKETQAMLQQLQDAPSYVQEGWIAVPREIFAADADARGPIWILDHRLAGETLEQAIAPYISP
jgi:hypothetical protein